MKYNILVCLIFELCILTQCVTHKKSDYEFPSEMSQAVKTDYRIICDKGRNLYQANCAGCHNIKKGRREYVPDFSKEELEEYELRSINTMHENNITEQRVSAEELGYIKTYLSYKRKNPTNLIIHDE